MSVDLDSLYREGAVHFSKRETTRCLEHNLFHLIILERDGCQCSRALESVRALLGQSYEAISRARDADVARVLVEEFERSMRRLLDSVAAKPDPEINASA